MMSVNDIKDIQDTITNRQLMVDNKHPHYPELDSTLTRFNMDEENLALVDLHTIRSTSNALSMAIMRGVITPNREYLDKFARDIKDKKVTETDTDRVVVEGDDDNAAKKYLRGLWSKLVDKSQNEIVDMLFTVIRTESLYLAKLIIKLTK